MKSHLASIKIPEDLSLAQFLLSHMCDHEQKIALVDGSTGQSYTYGDCVEKINCLAAALDKLGVRQHDIILVHLHSCVDYPIIVLACSLLGAVVAPTSPFSTAYELEDRLRQVTPKYAFSQASLLDNLHQADSKLRLLKNTLLVGPGSSGVTFDSLVNSGRTNWNRAPVEIIPTEHVALLPTSSGTTGKPKSVMLTHYNLISNILQVSHPAVAVDRGPGRRFLLLTPLFHVSSLTLYCLTNLMRGNTIIILPRYDLGNLLHCIERYKVEVFGCVPPVALDMLKTQIVDKYDLTSLIHVTCGAAPLGKESSAEMRQKFSFDFSQGYGMTEASPVTHLSPRRGYRDGSVGVLLPNTECMIMDVAIHEELGANQRGEIWVKGPQVMKGYHGDPESTSVTLKSGWLRTGDIGYVDEDGFLYIVDRLKELIKYKGYQVAPASLEALLLDHPGVADVAVVGVPDLKAGQLPRAFVVRTPGQRVTEAELCAHVAERVAPQQKLRGGVEFVDSIPKSAAGKILRRILLEQYVRKDRKQSKL